MVFQALTHLVLQRISQVGLLLTLLMARHCLSIALQVDRLAHPGCLPSLAWESSREHWALVTPKKQGKAGWGDKLKKGGVPYSLQETTWHQGSKAASRKPGMVKTKDVNQASLQTHGLHL